MDPYALSPLGHSSKIGFGLVKLLVRHDLTESLGGSAILQPGDKVDSFSPQILGEFGIMEHGANLLE